jgi:hypothetical protein
MRKTTIKMLTPPTEENLTGASFMNGILSVPEDAAVPPRKATLAATQNAVHALNIIRFLSERSGPTRK